MADRVTIGRSPPTQLIAIRVRADDVAARAAVVEALGMELPSEPQRPSVARGSRIFWVAPDHFLLAVGTDGRATAAQLCDALRVWHIAVLDVTDTRTVFTVSGPAARELLAGGTGVDLHPRAFRTGGAALTRFAALSVLLTQISEVPAFELFAERAAEEYLWKWLNDAARVT
jgi:sarcosine oxidase subunit gamma